MATIVDVTEQTFQTEVIERSREVPVVVDFWAAWCAPCRQLTPALEAATKKREGDVVLAKVDTEANPRLSQVFRVQSIPAVKAFKDGKIVAEFIGAQPPPAVERFFDALVPSETDRLIAAGDEESLRKAVELEPGRAEAGLPLAKKLLERGERAEALTVLNRIPGSFPADGMAARIRLEQADAVDGIAPALAALDGGKTEKALDGLVEAIAGTDDPERKEELRRIVVGVLDELGVDHPLARETRRKLAKALF